MVDYNIIDDLKYAATHEWVKIEGDVAIVGISDYAQHQLGDVVFVEMPELDIELEQGADACVVESSKAAGDVLMPLSGTIIQINEALVDKPELVNESPYVAGWIMKIKISDSKEIEALLSASDYKALILEEENK
ncbi:MAG: glycine cleavage system protein GcvH [Promethearchaeota archaeon]